MTSEEKRLYNILIADDDSDDRQMIKEAFEENNFSSNFYFVEDGEELVDYLNYKGKYQNDKTKRCLDLILLDLNMPKKDGREALKEIKSNPALKSIPVIVMTTSKLKDDIMKSYSMGVNCFISKPTTYSGLIEVTRSIIKHWFEIAQLPCAAN
jgi:CheY-like chemotaxis protein